MPRRSRQQPVPATAALSAGVRRRSVLLTGVGLSLAALALYLLTMAPGLTWKNTGGDGGDFLAAAFAWGIPHPTGYPTYIVLLRVFGEVLPFGSEAFRGNLFSAVTAAVAVGVLFGAVWRLLGAPGDGRPTKTRLAVSAFGAASFATGNLFWSQATITEVYALGGLFGAGLLWMAVEIVARLKQGHRPAWMLAAAAFVFGLSLGNSVTIALFALPLVAFVLYELKRRFGPRALLEWRAVAGFVLGLSIYVYAPIASAQDPPLNWFMPHTWDGFWQMASASLYRDYLFGTRPGFVPNRIVATLDLWLTQYSIPGAILGVAGLSMLWERMKLFAAATVASALLLVVYAIVYYSFDPYVYLVGTFMLFAIWIAVGLNGLIDGTRSVVQRNSGVPGMLKRYPVAIVMAAAVLLVPVWSVAFNYRHIDISDDSEAVDYVEESFATAGTGSLVFAEDIHAFSLWYQEMVVEPDADVAIVAVHMLPYDWYWEHLGRRYPDRVPTGTPPPGWTDRVAALVEHNRDRPLFLTDDSAYSESWTLSKEGPLLRVQGP